VANLTPSGASISRQSLADRIAAWGRHHRFVSQDALLRLLDTPLAAITTWIVVAIALALPIILYLLLNYAGTLRQDWDGSPRISLYLHSGVDERLAADLTSRLLLRSDVASADLITRQQALLEFEQHSGFGDILNTLPDNPLPALIEISPVATDGGDIRLLVASLQQEDWVEEVIYDADWMLRLFTMLELAERLTLTIGIVLAVGVLLIIGNTIRLTIENRRSEIEVVKLVGGTDGFVRRPFLYLGFWLGLGGALGAWLVVQLSIGYLSGPIERLAQSYRNDFALRFLSIEETCLILIGGSFLGVVAALLSVGQHLSRIQPQ